MIRDYASCMSAMLHQEQTIVGIRRLLTISRDLHWPRQYEFVHKYIRACVQSCASNAIRLLAFVNQKMYDNIFVAGMLCTYAIVHKPASTLMSFYKQKYFCTFLVEQWPWVNEKDTNVDSINIEVDKLESHLIQNSFSTEFMRA